jgi:Predicted alternative thymidylate synthase
MKIELLGSGEHKDIERRIKTVAAACKLSRASGTVLGIYDSCNDYESNLKFIKRVINMGHESTIEHDYLVLALSEVSPIIEQTIIGSRLASFTVKSRREVDFRKVGYYVPKFRNKEGNIHSNNEQIIQIYKTHMQSLFDDYGKFVDQGINVEDARFILPYCFNSEIIMGMDVRSLERLTKSLLYGKNSNIQELKELGENLLTIINEAAPYLSDKITQSDTDNADMFAKFRGILPKKINILEKPKLIKGDQDCSRIDDIILESTIIELSQCNNEEAKEVLKKMSYEDKKELMQTVLKSIEQREFEQVNFQFQIPISLAVLTHLTRHRMHSLIVPDFAPMWDLNNYIIPDSIKKLDENGYRKIYERNYKTFEMLKELDVMEEDLVYFYLAGNMCNVLTTMNGRTLEWISRMRCCNKAQWQIRDIAKEMVKQVKEIAPLFGDCLGPTCTALGYCPEGKESCKLKKRG